MRDASRTDAAEITITDASIAPQAASARDQHQHESVDRRTVIVLAASVLVMGLGQTTLLTFVPVLLERTGLSPARVAIAFAVGSALFLIGAPAWSRYSDRIGRRAVVIVGLLGFALSHALLLWQLGRGPQWAGHDTMLLAGRVLYGLTVSGLVPTCQAWLADLSTPGQRLGVLSRLSAGLTLGRLLGPALAAASLWLSQDGPLWLLSLAACPALLALPLARTTNTHAGAIAKTKVPWRSIGLWLSLAFAMQAALGQIQYAVGPWLGLHFGLSSTAASASLGWMLTATAAIVIVLQLWIVPRCRPGRVMLWVGSGVLALSGISFALASNMSGIWLGFAALGIASALLVPTYTALASLSAGKEGQSRVAGALSVAHTVGFSIATALAGALFDWWPVLPFWVAAGLGLVMCVLAIAARHSPRIDPTSNRR